MAVTPAAVAQTIATDAIVDEVEMRVDKKLMTNAIHRNPDGGIDVIVPGHLEAEQKLSLVDRYTKAGWKTVRVMNSSDLSARLGLVMVTLVG